MQYGKKGGTPPWIPIAIAIGVVVAIIAILFLFKEPGSANVSVADSVIVQDEGTPLTQYDTINYVGSYVTCDDDAVNSRTNCTWITPTPQPTATPQVGSSAHIIEDEGTPLTQRDNLNFVGNMVACADDNPDTTCTFTDPTPQPTPTLVPTATPQSGLGHGIQDETTPLPSRSDLNFEGDLITCADDDPRTTCTVTNPTPQPTATLVPTSTPQPTATVQPAYDTVQEEGVGVTQRDTLNFEGDLITCADDNPVTTCTLANPTPVSTATPQPTPTAVPTATAQPTATPLPSGNTRFITYLAENPADTDSFLISKMPFAVTITSIKCIVDPADTGESAVIEVFETDGTGDTPATVDASITCDNDGAQDDGSLSNPSIDSGDFIEIDTGTITGTVTQLMVTITYTVP